MSFPNESNDRDLPDLGPMSDDERAGLMLTYFSLIIEDFTRPQLLEFRQRILERFPDTPEQETILQVIDGQLALLGISKQE